MGWKKPLKAWLFLWNMILENASSCLKRLRLHPLKETLQNLIVALKRFCIKCRHFCHVFLPLRQLLLKLKSTANGSEKTMEAKPSLSKPAMVIFWDTDLVSPYALKHGNQTGNQSFSICVSGMDAARVKKPSDVKSSRPCPGTPLRSAELLLVPAIDVRDEQQWSENLWPTIYETGDHHHFRDWDPYHSISCHVMGDHHGSFAMIKIHSSDPSLSAHATPRFVYVYWPSLSPLLPKHGENAPRCFDPIVPHCDNFPPPADTSPKQWEHQPQPHPGHGNKWHHTACRALSNIRIGVELPSGLRFSWISAELLPHTASENDKWW